VLPGNPRYFTADGRHAVYLTGAHTWNAFQDWGPSDPPAAFDFGSYLDFLTRYGHNFIRLYVWEQAAWFPGEPREIHIAPLPYRRTGPGLALDGEPRFDLSQFDPAYFERLRDRVVQAGRRGIYVSVMLFDGWSIESKGQTVGNPFAGHPFNRRNNVNRVDGDANHDGQGTELHSLAVPAITALQRAYVAKVVSSIGDLDNVLWEISNESPPGSAAWEAAMIAAIRSAEDSIGKHHPIGMTAMWPSTADNNATLLASAADWISPHAYPIDKAYLTDPPDATGRKVVLLDTDHLWGVGGSPGWVWKSFFRGYNPLFMDPYTTALRDLLPAWPSDSAARRPDDDWNEVRAAMGHARAVAARIDLAAMTPADETCSSRYCLVSPGREYLVYLPAAQSRRARLLRLALPFLAHGSVTVDLSAAAGALSVEWIDPARGLVFQAPSIVGGGSQRFVAPFPDDAILHLSALAKSAAITR
jgi:hypothetical protein